MVGKAWMTPRVLAGDDEPLAVETDEADDVFCPGRGADHREDGRGLQPTLAPLPASDGDRL